MTEERIDREPESTSHMGTGIAIGLAIGTALGVVFGIALGNMAFMSIGVGAGLSIGIAIGAGLDARNKRTDAQTPVRSDPWGRRGDQLVRFVCKHRVLKGQHTGWEADCHGSCLGFCPAKANRTSGQFGSGA